MSRTMPVRGRRRNSAYRETSCACGSSRFLCSLFGLVRRIKLAGRRMTVKLGRCSCAATQSGRINKTIKTAIARNVIKFTLSNRSLTAARFSRKTGAAPVRFRRVSAPLKLSESGDRFSGRRFVKRLVRFAYSGPFAGGF
jgi:hypothetical protein